MNVKCDHNTNSQGRYGKREGFLGEKDVINHIDGFSKILNFDNCKLDGQELIDGVLWFDDTLLLTEVKTRVNSQRDIREWARKRIRQARKQIHKAYEKVKSGDHITLSNYIYKDIVLDTKRISKVIGIIVLKCDEYLEFTPHDLDAEMSNCAIPIHIFSYKSFIHTARELDTIPDFIQHLPNRGNELTNVALEIVRQVVGLVPSPEDKGCKPHPFGIYHSIETVPLFYYRKHNSLNNLQILNLEDMNIKGKESSFWTENIENTIIDMIKKDKNTFKNSVLSDKLKNDTTPTELHILWGLASLSRLERERIPMPTSNEVHSKFIEDDECDYCYWIHTHYIRNQCIIFYFSKKEVNQSKDVYLNNIIHIVKKDSIDRNIHISTCIAFCYNLEKLKESKQSVDMSYNLVSISMLDMDFFYKNFKFENNIEKYISYSYKI